MHNCYYYAEVAPLFQEVDRRTIYNKPEQNIDRPSTAAIINNPSSLLCGFDVIDSDRGPQFRKEVSR